MAQSSRLLQSARFNTTNSPHKSSSSSGNAYIVHLALLPTQYAAASSAPSNDIDIFDKVTLQGSHTLPGHTDVITSLHAVNNISGHLSQTLVSSGKDGNVKIWDLRSNSHAIKLTNLGNSRPLLCCDVSSNGLTIAAGTDLKSDDALIHYWDPRQPATPLKTHGSTHSDDITCVQFNLFPATSASTSTPQNTLLSASSDGLISISNADEDDEDEAVMFVGNWGCSIAQASWLPNSTIWAASDMETFSIWNEEMEKLQDLDIRAPSVHDHGRTWVTDYFITSQVNQGVLQTFVGSNEGDIALLSGIDSASSERPCQLERLWSNGHVGIVRALLWDSENNILVTGGEDSKINVWPSLPPCEEAKHEENDMVVDTPSRKRNADWEDEEELKGKRRRQ